VQTERAAHEQWTALTMRSPRAAALMHHFVALAMVRERWVQVVQIGASGTVNAYVLNGNVAWGERREQRARLSVFNAVVVGDAEDQPAGMLDDAPPLRRVPVIFPPEEALAIGEGEPGAQVALPGAAPRPEGGGGTERARFGSVLIAFGYRSDIQWLSLKPVGKPARDTEAAAERFITGGAPVPVRAVPPPEPEPAPSRKTPVMLRFDAGLPARVDKAAKRRRSAWIVYTVSSALGRRGLSRRAACVSPSKRWNSNLSVVPRPLRIAGNHEITARKRRLRFMAGIPDRITRIHCQRSGGAAFCRRHRTRIASARACMETYPPGPSCG
jgi:hypothetical protein